MQLLRNLRGGSLWKICKDARLHMGWISIEAKAGRTKQFHHAADHMDSWSKSEEATNFASLWRIFKIIKKAEAASDNQNDWSWRVWKRFSAKVSLKPENWKPGISWFTNLQEFKSNPGYKLAMKVSARRKGLSSQQLNVRPTMTQGLGESSQNKVANDAWSIAVICHLPQWIKCFISSRTVVFWIHIRGLSLPAKAN